MPIMQIEVERLGDIVNPLMKKYDVETAFLGQIWQRSEEDVKELLKTRLRDGDPQTVGLLDELLRKTGYFPLMQGVYENFALLAVRKAGYTEPDTCNIEPNVNADPFLIELFTHLFRCFQPTAQQMLVWDILYAETDNPVWMGATAEFVDQNLEWANKIYWKWNEMDFANLDNPFSNGIKHAIECITDEAPELDMIGVLESTPARLIMEDLLSDIEARCAPPDDQGIISYRTNEIVAYFEERDVPSFETILGILVSPLWYLDPDALTAEEKQEVHSAVRFFEFMKQYQYPPIKIPTLTDMKKLGRNPARYSREVIANDTKASIMREVWPNPKPEEDITAWVFVLDWKDGEDICNVIDHKWPPTFTAKREFSQKVFVPQQDQSAIDFYALSTTMPSYRKMAAQLAAVCDRKAKAICVKVPRVANTQYFGIVVGPDKETSDLLLQHGFGPIDLNQSLWKIGDEQYKIWIIPCSVENGSKVRSLEAEISKISYERRSGFVPDGRRKHSPHFHTFKICRDAIVGQ